MMPRANNTRSLTVRVKVYWFVWSIYQWLATQVFHYII